MRFLLLFILVSAPVYALTETSKNNVDIYVGGGGGIINVDQADPFEKDVSFKLGELIAGAYWRWVGIEARIGESLEEETLFAGDDIGTGLPIVAKTALKNYQSYYLRLQARNQIAHVYALYGQAAWDTELNFSNGRRLVLNTSGASWGLGAGIYVNTYTNFNVEFKSLPKSELGSIFLTSFNVTFHFF